LTPPPVPTTAACPRQSCWLGHTSVAAAALAAGPPAYGAVTIVKRIVEV
jgi:hypothetical protein